MASRLSFWLLFGVCSFITLQVFVDGNRKVVNEYFSICGVILGILGKMVERERIWVRGVSIVLRSYGSFVPP